MRLKPTPNHTIVTAATKPPKSQQSVKNTQNALLYPNQQPLKCQKTAEIRHFLTQNPSQPQINSNFHPCTPTHHIARTPTTPWTPRNFKKRPNLPPLDYRVAIAHPNAWFIIL